MLAELARRNLVLEHLVDLSRGTARNLRKDEVADDTRNSTRSSEASGKG